MDILERLTGQARRALHAAHRAAVDNHDDYVGTEHVLVALLADADAGAAALLQACQVDVAAMQQKVAELLERSAPGVEATKLPFTPAVKRALEAAAAEAARLQHAAVGTEHLLLGLCVEEDSLASFLLEQFGATPAGLREHLRRLPLNEDRDQAVQTLDRPGLPLRADPGIDEVRRLLEGPRRPPTPHGEDAGPPSVLASQDLAVLQALGCLPSVAIGLLLGTTVGALWGMWQMLVCMAVGLGLGALRSGWLGALGGAFAGYHLARRLCRDETEAMLLILVCIFAGSCVGDWLRRLLPPARREAEE